MHTGSHPKCMLTFARVSVTHALILIDALPHLSSHQVKYATCLVFR